MSKIFHYFLFSLIIFSCGDKKENSLSKELQAKKNEYYAQQKENETHNENNKQLSKEELEKNDYLKLCGEYFDTKDSLQKMAYQYFYDSSLIPALYSENVSATNKEFLSEFNHYLKRSWKEKFKIPIFKSILFPVFQDEGIPLSISSYPKYDNIDGHFDKFDYESRFFRNTKSIEITNDDLFQDSIRFKLFPGVVEEIYDGSPLKLFSINENTTGKIVSLGTTLNLCESYAFYTIKTDTTKAIPLIGSSYEINLKFMQDDVIDSIIQSSIHKCYDCPTSSDLKVFAQIEGVKNLYFTYTNSSPTPSRALSLKIGNHFVQLWIESIDQFGCSCL